MSEKVYLYLFILCAILAQVIVGTFLEEDSGESSNLLVREKRVINQIRGGDILVDSETDLFVVNIKTNNRVTCVATILSRRTAITAARCVVLETSAYTVTSGSTFTYLGLSHNITNIKTHSSHQSIPMAGISLIFVNPPFEHTQTTNIDLYSGPIRTGMHGIVIGWGSSLYGGPCKTAHPKRLRVISVPIISKQECLMSYRGIFVIGDEDICTYHQQKQCGFTDAGAPLVIDSKLVGVHIGVIQTARRTYHDKPDIFEFMNHFEYKQFVRANILH